MTLYIILYNLYNNTYTITVLTVTVHKRYTGHALTSVIAIKVIL